MLTVKKLSDQIRYDRDLVFYVGGHDGDGDTEEERGGAGEDDDMAAGGRRVVVGIRYVAILTHRYDSVLHVEVRRMFMKIVKMVSCMILNATRRS
ncbi:hypothetical protein E3N88_08314 [Mikania micrantha]|uniref:Uncharacterized protein n=1 Tax=Mikania micrantha TaxID=192012 RepID=A0A5N6PFV7_9ASTR|nr:hypothetical protein E3N88_08314 [Mikania micrantha]